jgi:hypothetical protein
MMYATVDVLFLWAMDMTLMQFPETGPEVAAGRIFKFAKKKRENWRYFGAPNEVTPGMTLTSINVCSPNQAN